MIPAKTRYKTHDGEILAIIKAFRTWRHDLEGCNQEVFILTNHNKLCYFMDMKNLSSCPVRWAQERSRYHFWIDYRRKKLNRAANALSRFLQQDDKAETNL